MSKLNSQARHKARRLVVQALYQWQYNETPVGEIDLQFSDDEQMKSADIIYFRDLLHGVLKEINEIDELLKPVLERPLENITPVELAVLRLAAYELKNRRDVPYRVIINEALELTKTFGTNDGYKFINGVLDKLAHQLRAVETKS